jgi:peptide deformylase
MQTEESDDLRAVCHQHEIDQLNGQFWTNRLSRLKRERLIKRFEKVSRGPVGRVGEHATRDLRLFGY